MRRPTSGIPASAVLAPALLAPALLAAAGALALSAAPAFAHHSYAMFDMQRMIEVKGTVKVFKYTNPHSTVILTSKDKTGKVVDAIFEANGPGYLARWGWNRNTLKVGDTATAIAAPFRDGTPGGSLLKMKLADGRTLDATPQIPGAPGPGENK